MLIFLQTTDVLECVHFIPTSLQNFHVRSLGGSGGVEALQLCQVAVMTETAIRSGVSTFVHMKPLDNLKETMGHLSAVFLGTKLCIFD